MGKVERVKAHLQPPFVYGLEFIRHARQDVLAWRFEEQSYGNPLGPFDREGAGGDAARK